MTERRVDNRRREVHQRVEAFISIGKSDKPLHTFFKLVKISNPTITPVSSFIRLKEKLLDKLS